MAEPTTFTKTDRNILNWRWFKKPETAHLWEYIRNKANYNEGSFECITIHRGEFVSSLQRMSEDTGLSIQAVRTGLKRLNSTGEITSTGTAKYTIITVNNWDKYQCSTQTLTNEQQTTNKQLTNAQQTTNNNQRKKESNKERIQEIYKEFALEHIEFDTAALLQTLTAFDEMRNARKKPLTDHARELMLSKLESMGGDMVAILNQSIMNGWLDIFPLKEQKKQPEKPKDRNSGLVGDEVDEFTKAILFKRLEEKRKREAEQKNGETQWDN